MRNLFLSYFCLVTSSLHAGALDDCIARLDEISTDASLRTPFVDVVVKSKLVIVREDRFTELPTSDILNKHITKPLRKLIRAANQADLPFPSLTFKAHKDDDNFTNNHNDLIKFMHSLDRFISTVVSEASAHHNEPYLKNNRYVFAREESANLWGQIWGKRRVIAGFHKHPYYDLSDFEYSFSPNWYGTRFLTRKKKVVTTARGNVALFHPLTAHGSPWRPLFLNRIFVYGRLKN